MYSIIHRIFRFDFSINEETLNNPVDIAKPAPKINNTEIEIPEPDTFYWAVKTTVKMKTRLKCIRQIKDIWYNLTLYII